jgi:hypothetical protein
MARPKQPPPPAPVAPTFEEDLERIKEKGKELKGDQKICYNSIVDRVANNVQVLAADREEFGQLRDRLADLVKQAAILKTRCDLPGDIQHTSHEVNLLKKQYDKLRRERVESIDRQAELEIVLANFRQAEIHGHPEDILMANMKNRLDRVNIKNGEVAHLAKAYTQIIFYFRRQTMHFAPIIRDEQQLIAHQERDIKDLVLISRDSRFASSTATSEYRQARSEISSAAKQRNEKIEQKKIQAIGGQQPMEAEVSKSIEKPQGSLISQPSAIRNRMTKLAREKREERFRQVSATYEAIFDFFRTTDPQKICPLLEERRATNAKLEKQIEDLRGECVELEAQANRLKSQIEEAEYTSAKGVGSARLIMEGQQILSQKNEDKKKAQRELDAVAEHQKQINAGCHHLREILALVDFENEGDLEPNAVLKWVYAKLVILKEGLENEDQEYLQLVNKETFALQKAKEDSAFEADEGHKKAAKTPGLRRGKDKFDVTSRVLTRAAVKALATKTIQSQAPVKKTAQKTK